MPTETIFKNPCPQGPRVCREAVRLPRRRRPRAVPPDGDQRGEGAASPSAAAAAAAAAVCPPSSTAAATVCSSAESAAATAAESAAAAAETADGGRQGRPEEAGGGPGRDNRPPEVHQLSRGVVETDAYLLQIADRSPLIELAVVLFSKLLCSCSRSWIGPLTLCSADLANELNVD